MVRRGTQQERGAATFVRPSNSSSFTSHNFRIAKTLTVKNYQNTSPTTRHTLGRQTASENLSPRSAPACREKMCRFHGKRNIFYAPLLLLQLFVSALHNPFVQTQRRLRKEINTEDACSATEGHVQSFRSAKVPSQRPSHDALARGTIRQRPDVCQRGPAVSLTLKGASAALTSVLRFNSEPVLAARRLKGPLAHLVIQLTRPEQAARLFQREVGCPHVSRVLDRYP